MMNKTGQMGFGMTVILSIFIFISFIGVFNLLTPEVNNFRVAMDCANVAGISSGVKVSCLLGDTVIVYFIGLVFSISVGAILSRFVLT